MTLVIKQVPAHPSNYRPGRGGQSVVGIVIHIEQGTATGTDAWFANPAATVSAHYSISKSGEIHQHVAEVDTAFHAGIVDRPMWWFAVQSPNRVNSCTIGIEHEGVATEDLTPAQYSASSALIADICRRRLIPIDSNHIVPHHSIRASKPCPGVVDMGKLIGLAKAVGVPTPVDDGGVPSSTLT